MAGSCYLLDVIDRMQGRNARLLMTALAVCLSLSSAAAQTAQGPSTPDQRVHWIWTVEHDPQRVPLGSCYFRKAFRMIEPDRGQLQISANDRMEVYLNGVQLGTATGGAQMSRYDLGPHMVAGVNVLAVRVDNLQGSTAGLAAAVVVKEKNEEHWRMMPTDGSWRATTDARGPWTNLSFDDSSWGITQMLSLGASTADHAQNTTGATREKPAEERPQPAPPVEVHPSTPATLASSGGAATGKPPMPRDIAPMPAPAATDSLPPIVTNDEVLDASQVEIDPEFDVTIVDEGSLGSYIAMDFDEFGRLILSRENAGLVRIDFAARADDPQRTQVICDKVKNCQGILPLNGKIYLTGEGPDGWGLYLIGDADNDSNFESVELIARFAGENAEHGPHGLVLASDGCIYLIVGNHSRLELDPSPTSPYTHAYEADLVPRVEDPGGHAVGIRAPGGTILRMPIQTRQFEVVAGGIRNAYDLAFDAAGELFFHDSDMESDEGTPWYRPTMIFQVLAGAEFGWRSGWAKFPTYYLDCVPPADSTGRGSPTGATFYHHLAFPARYHDALFLADWSEGRILVSRMNRHGSTVRGQTRPFLSAPALNVTDLAVGPDGALYFCTGGRGTQGSVGRIAWRGEVPESIRNPATPLLRILTFPQPESAWARQGLAKLRKQAGTEWSAMLDQAVRDVKLQARYRVRALELMNLYGPTASSDLLAQLAADADPTMRVAAARMMGTRPAGDVQSTLESLLADSDAWVRRVACESLIRCQATVSYERLLPLLASLDHGEAFVARRLLERIPSDQWREALLASDDTRLFVQGATALLIAEPSLEVSYSVLARVSQIFDGYVADADFLDCLRVVQLALSQGQVEPEKVPAFVFRMAEEFPSTGGLINRELAKILAYLRVVDIENRYAEYLTQSTDDSEYKLMVAMMLQTMADSLDGRDRIALLQTLEQSIAERKGGGSYEPYLSAAASEVVKHLSEEDWSEVWRRGAAWPNAMVAALFRLPEQVPAETLEQLIAVDRVAQKRDDASTRKLRAGIMAILIDSQAPASLDHVVESLMTLQEAIAIEALIALGETDYRPADAAHCRQLIEFARQRPGAPAAAAFALLEHWTGDLPGEAVSPESASVERWIDWFRQTFPGEEPVSMPANSTSKEWNVDDLLQAIRGDTGPRDATRGQLIYQQAQCARCHRCGQIGEGPGPDLTALGRRFNVREIIEATLLPSKVVSDQYRGKRVTTSDGKVYAGLLSVQADGAWIVTQVDGSQKSIAPEQVENMEVLSESTMPAGLLDNLTVGEVADLLHYLTADNPDRLAKSPPQ